MIPAICTKKLCTSLDSDSTWWWQSSWLEPNVNVGFRLIHSHLTWIHDSLVQFGHLWDSLKNTLTPIWLWLKVIQSDSNSFILTSLDWWQPSWILPTWIPTILDSAILVFSLNLTHTCQHWFPPFALKNFTHSFCIQLDNGSYHCIMTHAWIHGTAILDSDILVIISQIHSKTLSLQSDSNSN